MPPFGAWPSFNPQTILLNRSYPKYPRYPSMQLRQRASGTQHNAERSTPPTTTCRASHRTLCHRCLSLSIVCAHARVRERERGRETDQHNLTDTHGRRHEALDCDSPRSRHGTPLLALTSLVKARHNTLPVSLPVSLPVTLPVSLPVSQISFLVI